MRTPHHLARAFLRGGNPPGGLRGVGPLMWSVAPCSALSRTLRAGFAGAAGGLLDSACARRSADWRSGRRNGRCGRTKELTSCRRDRLRARVIGIVKDLPLEQFAKNVEQAIADATQRPPVTVATASQFGVAGSADWIVLDGHTRPMIKGIFQPLVAGPASDHEALLAAAARHRRPPPTGFAKHGNLVAAEARWPRRAAWRERSCRFLARSEGSLRHAARMSAPACSPSEPRAWRRVRPACDGPV